MCERETDGPCYESLISTIECAWRDHHHMRDQTWKTLQLEAVLCAALVAVEFKYENLLATLLGAILVILAGFFGLGITWQHRIRERDKFTHILNCQRKLGLMRNDIIPDAGAQVGSEGRIDGAVKVPDAPCSFFVAVKHACNLHKNNTFLFIFRMHAAFILVAVLFILCRVIPKIPALTK